MKKIILAAIAVSLMATSAMAFKGTVERVVIKADGTTEVVVNNGTSLVKRALPADAEIRKAMLAAAMTAYSTKSIVSVAKSGTIWSEFSLWTK